MVSKLKGMSEIMEVLEVDEEGRIYLPEETREKFGDRFLKVESDDSIRLIPLADDPVKDLRETMEKLQGMSIEEIHSKIKEEGIESLDWVKYMQSDRNKDVEREREENREEMFDRIEENKEKVPKNFISLDDLDWTAYLYLSLNLFSYSDAR